MLKGARYLNSQVAPANWGSWNGDITLHYDILSFWPEVPGPLIPENLPADVERIYLAAERNFPTEGNEEPAGAMYRKALDVGLKKIDAATRGTLAARIKKLAASGKLTPDIAEWSDHVRVLGNEADYFAAHTKASSDGSGKMSDRSSWRETPVFCSMRRQNSAGTPFFDFSSQYQICDCVVPMRSASGF